MVLMMTGSIFQETLWMSPDQLIVPPPPASDPCCL